MPNILRAYADLRGIPIEENVEDTLNNILVSLQNEPENVFEGPFRKELLSACAVVLNGMPKIKDPVKLFKNLVLAFERRGYCIFTNTVRLAFKRLWAVAKKQNRTNEMIAIWRTIKNPFARGENARYLPREELLQALKTRDDFVKEIAAETLVSRKDFTIKEIKALLSEKNFFIVKGAANGLAKRPDLPLRFLESLLSHPSEEIAAKAAFAIAIRKDINPDYLEKLIFCSKSKRSKINHCGVLYGIADAIRERKDLPEKFLLKLITIKIPDKDLLYLNYYLIRYNAAYSLAMSGVSKSFINNLLNRFPDESIRRAIIDAEKAKQRKAEEAKIAILKHIRGSRGKRKRTMEKLTSPLRTKKIKPKHA
ncbi:MAG: hypothetical protein QXM75_00265 [Candidatus Diapherotrites archaeon]